MFHDGEPFTSADVLFTFGRLVGHPNVNQWNGVRHFLDIVVGMREFSEGEADEVVGLSAPDDYTFVFEMTNPYRGAFLEKLLYFAIMPKHLLSQYPEDTWGIDEQGQQGLKNTPYAKEQGIGTGPFKVSNYIPDQIVEYEPFEDYFRGKPQLEHCPEPRAQRFRLVPQRPLRPGRQTGAPGLEPGTESPPDRKRFLLRYGRAHPGFTGVWRLRRQPRSSTVV